MYHNLLTSDRKHTLIVEYRMRLGSVVLVLASLVGFVGALSLLPTMITLHAAIRSSEAELGAGALVATTTDKTAADQATLSELKVVAATFERTLKEREIADIIRGILALRGENVRISGVVYDRTTSTVELTGVARARDDLVSYAHALEDSPLVGKVTLPISDLAKQTNILFKLTLPLESAASTSQ